MRRPKNRGWSMTAAEGCRRSTGGFLVEGGAGRPTATTGQLGFSGLRPPFPRSLATFDLDPVVAWPLFRTVGAVHEEYLVPSMRSTT